MQFAGVGGKPDHLPDPDRRFFFPTDDQLRLIIDFVPNRKSQLTVLILQSCREGGKVRKRTLANITKLPPDVIEKIREILRGAVVADAPAGLKGAFAISRSLQHGNASTLAFQLGTNVVLTCKRLGRVERAFRTMQASDLQVRPIRHRLERRVRAHLLICMLAYHVEMHKRKKLAPMLFDNKNGPVRDSPVAKAERSPQAKRKIAAKRTRSGKVVHDFLRLLAQLGTLTMNRIEPSGPGKLGFDVPSSPTPTQDNALRLLNAKIPMR